MIRYIIICVIELCILHTPEKAVALSGDNTDYAQDKKTKKTEVVIKDSDGDGVPDSEDECPYMAGPAATKGCPDSDGDGIPDHLDDCPNAAGLLQFKGCPDSDGDGVPDNKDICPTVPGVASNNGCPLSNDEPAKPAFSSNTPVVSKVYEGGDVEKLLERQREETLMRYDRYMAEQEELNRLKMNPTVSEFAKYRDEFEKEQRDMTRMRDHASETGKTAVTPSGNGNKSNNGGNGNTAVNQTTFSRSDVYINSLLYQSLIPRIEVLLHDLRFEKGRLYFVDDRKSFDALQNLADMFNEYVEWEKIVFNCYSNNETTSNIAYRDDNLFSNRMAQMRTVLNKKNVSPQRVEFKRKSNPSSNISNYIQLEIYVK